MTNPLKDLGTAYETEYFHRKEKELIATMKSKLEFEKSKNLAIK